MKTPRFVSFLFTLLLAAPAFAALTPQQVQQEAAQIDQILAQDWQANKVTPNAPASDETFLRRIYLDLAGRIPTADESTAFLKAARPDKRFILVQYLLQRESYVSRFYNFWADILRLKSRFNNTAHVIPAAYEKFIKESLRTNKPYDQFVREMLSAKGYAWDTPAVGYYQRDPGMPLDNMAITSRIFLGTRIECAQCHDHPFDKWKQTDFYHLAAYTNANKSIEEAFEGARLAIKKREDAITADFKKEKAASTDGGKAAESRKKERMEAMHYRKIVGIIKGCVGQLFSPIGLQRKPDSVLKLPHDYKYDNAKPFEVMQPATLMGEPAPIAGGQDSAEVFATWVTSPQNPRFTKVIVNRLWKTMFGLPLVERFDDLRDEETKPMIPALQTQLEKLMVTLRYDMKDFLAVIASTRAYQSVTSAEAYASGTVYHFTGPVLRRMTAEQIWDSLVTLGSHQPDARDLKREEREERRINVSKMACEAYLNFDGDKLVDMAYARLQAEQELEKRESAVREAMIVAKRNGDKAKEIELRHQEGAFDKERGETFVKEFIMPILTQLAQKKAGKDAVPVVDASYKINSNPRVLPTETWKRLHVPGYGPAPKTPEQLAAEVQAEKQRLADLATKLHIPEAKQRDFIAYCQNTQAEWLRASELESPAPRGHPLRTLGQSDRDFVENANPAAAIPQALMLMNSDLITNKGLLSPWSPLMLFINQAETPEAKVEAAYLALLSRHPTPEEKAIWASAPQELKSVETLVYALLNTKQFIFVQ